MQTDWIEWEGGEIPVPEGTLVEVRHRDGREYICGAGDTYASDWTIDPYFWDDGDIIAYCIVTPQQ